MIATDSRPTIRRTVDIDGRAVGLTITILHPEDRHRVAALIAWLATSNPDAADPHHWHVFVSDVLSRYVAFTVDESALARVSADWWELTLRAATIAFVKANKLEAHIRCHACRDDAMIV